VSFTFSYGSPAQPTAATLVASAFQHYSARRFPEAEADCRRALALEPAHAEALYMLGMVHGEGGQYAPATDCFRKATEVNPKATNCWIALGMALRELGRLDEAENALRAALALVPNLAPAHFELGRVLKDRGLTEEADECLKHALVLNPNLMRPDNALGEVAQDFGLYVSHRPASDIVFRHHPEFKELLRKWISNNSPHNHGDIARLYALMLNVKQLLAEGVSGDMAELGVYRGNSAAVLAHYSRAYGRQLYLFDTFEGFDGRDLQGIDQKRGEDFSDTSLELVRRLVGQQGVVYVPGFFPQSIPSDISDLFAVVHLDCDLYTPMKAGLAFFYPRLSPGGLLILHDYSSGYFPGAKQAIDEFAATIQENLVLLPDRFGSALIRKNSKA
jgi:Macrocin-O-methyltransferase (TylF)/Anaphase-promoting complex, cyclosome, subunit 3/Tetratricopeptide repeat